MKAAQFRWSKLRRLVLLAVAVSTLVSGPMARETAASPEGATDSGHKHPNIVFVLTDDQRFDDLAYMPRTKRLLVDEGMSFINYVDTVSLCCPSRVSILRGQYAHNTGVLTNDGKNGGFVAAHKGGIEESTIATWLHDSGYKTALVGKYLNHYPADLGSYVPPGWDYWASPVGGNPYSQFNYVLNENGKTVRYGNSPEDYGTDVYLRHAQQFIKQCGDKPFFLYLAFYAPHEPATAAPRHRDLFAEAKVPRTRAFNESDVTTKPEFIQNRPLLSGAEMAGIDELYARRLRSLQAVDEAVEALCQTLEKARQLDNTYVVFVSDNGFHLGEHRLRKGKQTAYETDIHLPLIVRGPGIAGGVRAGQLVGNIDLGPTFAELAGVRAPDFVDGRSLAPILHGPNKDEPLQWRNTYLVEHWNAQKDPQNNLQAVPDEPVEPAGDKAKFALPEVNLPVLGVSSAASAAFADDDRDKPVKNRRGKGRIPEYHALRTTHSTYVEYVTGEREFYALDGDLDEVNNLAAGQNAAAKKEHELAVHSKHLEKLKSAAGAASRALENEE